MFKRKCPSCAKKIERKFNYCPYCGASFKIVDEREDFGMLGRDDSTEEVREEIKLPFGIEGIMNSLIKQLEKQMGSVEKNGEVPRGFQIRISNGQPQMRQIVKRKNPVKKEVVQNLSEEEAERRANLKRVEAESKVKRLGDVIIYELSAPGISSKKDVVITKLEQGVEVKAYSKNRCYVKIIPLKIEVLGFDVRDEKVIVEMKG